MEDRGYPEIEIVTDEEVSPLKEWIFSHRTAFLAALLTLAVVLLLIYFGETGDFSGYTVRSEAVLDAGSSGSYAVLDGNLLRFSADGAFCTTFDGQLLWNDTYEMSDPRVHIRGKYGVFYDRGGTDIRLVDVSGRVAALSMSLPVVEAQTASNGSVAVLLQQEDIGYVRVYNRSGELFASGEVHLENTGYPVAMAFGEDGLTLALSLVDIADGDVKTTIVHYQFGKTGADKDNYIVGTNSFSNMLIPRLSYLEGGRLVAFGDSEILVFDNKSQPGIETQLFPEGRIRAVFFCDNAFGYVIGDESPDEAAASVIRCYKASGQLRYEETYGGSYSSIWMLENGELAVCDDDHLTLYTAGGGYKLSCEVDDYIQLLAPTEGARDYLLVQGGTVRQIRLR